MSQEQVWLLNINASLYFDDKLLGVAIIKPYTLYMSQEIYTDCFPDIL